VFLYTVYVPLRFGSGIDVGRNTECCQGLDPWPADWIESGEDVNVEEDVHLACRDLPQDLCHSSHADACDSEDARWSQGPSTIRSPPPEASWAFSYTFQGLSVSSSSLSSDDSPRLHSASSSSSEILHGLEPIMEERSFREDMLGLKDGFVSTSSRTLQHSKSELPKDRPRPLPSPYDSPLARKLQDERDELGYPTSYNLAALIRGSRSPDLRTMSCPGSLVCTPRSNATDQPWQ
jgi:hypothetical protein